MWQKQVSFWVLPAITAILLVSHPAFAQRPNNASQPQFTIEVKNEDRAVGESTKLYALGQGDLVEITVKGQPEFSGQFVVGPDGNIQYNFAGDVKAEGLTKYQLKDAVIKTLEKYVREPDISITIVEYRSKFVYIFGEVGKPGKYPMKGDKVTLRELLVAAGLPTRDAALRRVIIVKPNTDKPTYQLVDIYLLLYKGLLKNDIALTPDDLVVVPSTVPSEINRALTNMLSPITQGASAAGLYKLLTQ